MVRAELKSLFSWDFPSGWEDFTPDDPENFGIYLVAFVGTEGEEGSTAFDFIACTANWLAENEDITCGVGFPWAKREEGVASLRGFYLLESWDFAALEQRIAELCRDIEGPDWDSIEMLLNKFLVSEYDRPASA